MPVYIVTSHRVDLLALIVQTTYENFTRMEIRLFVDTGGNCG
jgi:hypothetical protein